MMYTTIVSVDTLYAHLTNPRWIIVDCRFHLNDSEAGRAAYLNAHIPGAIYVHLNEDLSAPPAKDIGRHPLPDLNQFRARVGAWGISNNHQVVAYDDAGGTIAARLWWMLRYLGHTRVALLDGGWQAWVAADYPITRDVEVRPPAQFKGEPDSTMAATLSEVESLVNSGNGGRLLDSRAAVRYRGEYEPIDQRAGHIPGAKNRPTSENVGAELRFHAANDLRDDFERLLDGTSPEDTIAYCGSGVTAAHNLLAMEIAGLRGARLFIPSWSGWSSDPERPIATGAESD